MMLLVAITVALLAGAAPAQAGMELLDTPVVVTDTSSLAPGGTLEVSASGFEQCLGDEVTFTITPVGGGAGIVVTAPLLADGSAHATITAPGVLGDYTVTATCGEVVASSGVGIRNEPSVGSQAAVGSLPAAGSNVGMPLRIAGVFVVVGGGLFVVALRRRRTVA